MLEVDHLTAIEMSTGIWMKLLWRRVYIYRHTVIIYGPFLF